MKEYTFFRANMNHTKSKKIYNHVLHSNLLVKDKPHIQQCSNKIKMELKNSYCQVTSNCLNILTQHITQIPLCYNCPQYSGQE